MCIRMGRLHVCCALALVLLACMSTGHAQESARDFDIPAAEASKGLSLFAKQASAPLLYLNDAVRSRAHQRGAWRPFDPGGARPAVGEHRDNRLRQSQRRRNGNGGKAAQ